jgi:predicted AlkP superfamily pyrophosphatase or phosphodiesterase
MTYPAHTTLVTGARPARHGISNNIVFDPFNKNEHGWYWYAYDIKVPTLWDVARKEGLEVGNVYWPVTVGAEIPFSIPQIWRSKTDEDDKLLRALTTRGLNRSAKAPAAEHRGDRERTDAALEIIREHHPRLMFVYLTDLDTVQHERGPMSSEALKTLKSIDGYVGELVSAYGKDPPTLALVSDHGFASVTKEVRLNVALREKHLLSVAGTKLSSYKMITWKAGATAAMVPLDPKDSASAKMTTELFTKLAKDPANGIARVYTNDETASAFAAKNAVCILVARPGYLFSESFEPPLVVKSSSRGGHGYAPELPEMGASLFFWGDGIRKADLGEVDMIDVAPTIASLLDLQLPEAEGKPLKAALASQP